MSKLADTITEAPDGTHGFRCPSPVGCGPLANDPESRFTSTGWPTAKIAQARGVQHIAEHVDGTPTQNLDEFRAEHGVVPVTPTIDPVDLTAYLPKQD